MGLLDKFIKRYFSDEDIEQEVIVPEKYEIDNVLIDETEDGRPIFEYYDAHRNFKRYSNTIRIIINNEPRIVRDRELYDCMITWWKQNDPNDENERKENREKSHYEHIIAGIDPEEMLDSKNNYEYLRYTMKNLLEENMVKRYIETALIPDDELKRPEKSHIQPCGRYIGEVVRKGNVIGKVFSNDIGRILHYSLEMELERVEAEKQRAIRNIEKDVNREKAKLEARSIGYEEQAM